MNIDYFMSEAIAEAKKAYIHNEVPVGGLIVDNITNTDIKAINEKFKTDLLDLESVYLYFYKKFRF